MGSAAHRGPREAQPQQHLHSMTAPKLELLISSFRLRIQERRNLRPGAYHLRHSHRLFFFENPRYVVEPAVGVVKAEGVRRE